MESFNPFNLRLSRSSRRHEASENKRDLRMFLIHRLLLGLATFIRNMGAFVVGTAFGSSYGSLIGYATEVGCLEGGCIGAFLGGAIGGAMDTRNALLNLQNENRGRKGSFKHG